MKTISKVISTLIILISLSGFAGGQDGNGGGGVHRNGIYMTFYSAGFYTEPVESPSEDVPQLDGLMSFFESSPFLGELKKNDILKALRPSPVRHYYRVKADAFNPDIRARLIAEYARATKANEQELTLFAVTDILSQTTYLLPEFYDLKPIEQKAILFHEAYWIVNPASDYKKVIQAEMAFQAYLENMNSPQRLLSWISYVGKPIDNLRALIKVDLASGSLGDFVQSGRYIPVVELFGEQFFKCIDLGVGGKCWEFFVKNLYGLAKTYPRSLLMQLLYNRASENKVEVIFTIPSIKELFPRDSIFPETVRTFAENLLTLATRPCLQTSLHSGKLDLQIDGFEDGITFGLNIVPGSSSSSWSLFSSTESRQKCLPPTISLDLNADDKSRF